MHQSQYDWEDEPLEKSEAEVVFSNLVCSLVFYGILIGLAVGFLAPLFF